MNTQVLIPSDLNKCKGYDYLCFGYGRNRDWCINNI